MNDSSLFIELEEIPLEEMTPEDIEKLSITTTGITNQRRPDFLKTGNVARPIDCDSTKTNPKNQHSVINH